MQRLFERVVTFAFLLMIVGVLTVLFLGSGLHERTVEEGALNTSVGVRICEALVYSGCAIVILSRYRQTLRALRGGLPFLLIALFAILSTVWSVDAASTLRRGLVLFTTTAFGIYLGGRYTTQQIQILLYQFLSLLIVASLVLAFVLPHYAIDTFHGDAFRGITEHKNIFGEYMGVFLLLSLTYPFRSKERLPRTISLTVAFAMLAASRSGTALVAAVLTVVILPLLLVVRFSKRLVLPLGLAAVLLLSSLGYAASHYSSLFLDLLGKDSTLTGRAAIWVGVGQAITQRPLLGYGYDAFWQGLHGESLQIVAAVGWLVPHSHNGYLEALLGIGALGTSLLVFCIVRMGKDAVLYVRRVPGLPGLWPSAFLLYFLVHATAEASLLEREGLSYLMFISIATALSLDRLGMKQSVSAAIEQKIAAASSVSSNPHDWGLQPGMLPTLGLE